MIFENKAYEPRKFKVTFLETLTPREQRRTPHDCADMGNIRIHMETMDSASVQDVLATLPEGSFYDAKEEDFKRKKIKNYQPPVRKPLVFAKAEQAEKFSPQLPPSLPASKPYIKFIGL